MKRRFNLEPWPEGYCDILVAGQKVSHAFNAERDNIALKVPDWVTEEMVEKIPHDPRIVLAPRGDNKYFELNRPEKVEQGVTFGQSVDVEVVRNESSENDRNQVSAVSEDRGKNSSGRSSNRRNKNDRSRGQSSKVRLQSSGK